MFDVHAFGLYLEYKYVGYTCGGSYKCQPITLVYMVKNCAVRPGAIARCLQEM